MFKSWPKSRHFLINVPASMYMDEGTDYLDKSVVKGMIFVRKRIMNEMCEMVFREKCEFSIVCLLK